MVEFIEIKGIKSSSSDEENLFVVETVIAGGGKCAGATADRTSNRSSPANNSAHHECHVKPLQFSAVFSLPIKHNKNAAQAKSQTVIRSGIPRREYPLGASLALHSRKSFSLALMPEFISRK